MPDNRLRHSWRQASTRLTTGLATVPLGIALVSGAFVAGAAEPNGDRNKQPSAGPPRVIGIYANGCISGARRLPPAGTGFVVIRRHRNRFWGHPRTLAFVRALGRHIHARFGRAILVADISAPRGGPISGHASHEVGLDADIRFLLVRPARLGASYRARPPQISMVAGDYERIDRRRWSSRQVAMLRYAARHPQVDRIFVNPVIKRELCRSVKGDRSWLRRVVPWYGHDAHMHVRMKCPADSPQCIKQTRLPAGTGCGRRVQRWFAKILPAWRKWKRSGRKAKPRPRVELPTACLILFNE